MSNRSFDMALQDIFTRVMHAQGTARDQTHTKKHIKTNHASMCYSKSSCQPCVKVQTYIYDNMRSGLNT